MGVSLTQRSQRDSEVVANMSGMVPPRVRCTCTCYAGVVQLVAPWSHVTSCFVVFSSRGARENTGKKKTMKISDLRGR